MIINWLRFSCKNIRRVTRVYPTILVDVLRTMEAIFDFFNRLMNITSFRNMYNNHAFKILM